MTNKLIVEKKIRGIRTVFFALYMAIYISPLLFVAWLPLKWASFSLAKLPVFGFVGLQADNISTDMASYLAVIIGLLYGYHRVCRVNKIHASLVDALNQWTHPIDYYNVGNFRAIAVSVKDRSITIASGAKPKLLTFGVDKLIDWEAVEQGYTTTDSYKHTYDNIEAKNKAFNTTGLYINLDDINNPQAFAQMPIEDANKWVLILKKLCDETLESQDKPLLFPANK